MKKNLASLRELILAVFLVAALGMLQNTNFLNIAGVKPNLSLVLLIALSFFIRNFFVYLILVLVAGIFLRFEAAFEPANLVFTLLVVAVYLLERKLPGRQFLNSLLLTALGTFIFYAVIDFSFFASYLFTIFEEMLYNIILGVLLFFISKRFFFHEAGFGTKF